MRIGFYKHLFLFHERGRYTMHISQNGTTGSANTPALMNPTRVSLAKENQTALYRHNYAVQNLDGSIDVVDEHIEIDVRPSDGGLGIMVVGMAGNNGTTLYASIAAKKRQLEWRDKTGVHSVELLGSISQTGDLPVAHAYFDDSFVYKSVQELCDLVQVEDIVVGGWDINGANMYDATLRAQVLPYALTSQLREELEPVTARPGVYYPDFIAANQTERATNVLSGTKPCDAHLDQLRKDIRDFKELHKLERVVVMWSGNTERMVVPVEGVHDTAHNLLDAISNGSPEVSPSMMYACAATLEGCTFVNCAPQNTCVHGVEELAHRQKTHLVGRDLKSGQTKLKACLTDFLVSSGFRLRSIASYNHLGNNDGRNLSEAPQFESKKKSKTDLVQSVVDSSASLYTDESQHPDHTVVIKYQPHVGDDKRAMDEYISEVAVGGQNVMSIYNICPDSLLAVGVMLDIALFSDWCTRIYTEGEPAFGIRLEVLNLFFKHPLSGQTDRFFMQRDTLAHTILATNGLPPFSPGSTVL